MCKTDVRRRIDFTKIALKENKTYFTYNKECTALIKDKNHLASDITWLQNKDYE